MTKEELNAVIAQLTPEQLAELKKAEPAKKEEPKKDCNGIIVWDAAACMNAVAMAEQNNKSFWDRLVDGAGDVLPWVVGALAVIAGAKLLDAALRPSPATIDVGE